MKTYIILHDIRSVYNVGSIFRTADAAGVEKIYCTGYTPTPVDQFGRARKDIAKVSLGAEKNILWEQMDNVLDVIKELQTQKMYVVAVEQAGGATTLKEFTLHKNTAYIFGNEVDGIPSFVLKDVDEVLEIPMCGKKESLNVSVAAGVVLFHYKN